MNDVVQFGSPGALGNRQRAAVMDDMGTGLGASRGAHISLKSGRFKLVNAAGMETPVQSLALDVIVIAASPVVNRVLFEDYVPGNEQPPICFSDNGKGPSVNSVSPQSPVCETCPMNVRGSDTTFTGKATTACQRRKKLAVILPGDPAVNVYEMQVPPASLTPLKEYRDWISRQASPFGRPVDIADLVTRLEWSTEKQFVITFRPVGWASDERTLQVIDYIDQNHLADQAIGLNDQPCDPQRVAEMLGSRPAPQQLAAPSAPPQQFQLPPLPAAHPQQGFAAPPNPQTSPHPSAGLPYNPDPPQQHQWAARTAVPPFPHPSAGLPSYGPGQLAAQGQWPPQQAPQPPAKAPRKPRAPKQMPEPGEPLRQQTGSATVVQAPQFQHPEMQVASAPAYPQAMPQGAQQMPPIPDFLQRAPGPRQDAPAPPSHGMQQPMQAPPEVSQALQQAMNLRPRQ